LKIFQRIGIIGYLILKYLRNQNQWFFKNSKNYPTLKNPPVLIYYNCLGHLASTFLQSYAKYGRALGNGY
jgi:hypothetical protein